MKFIKKDGMIFLMPSHLEMGAPKDFSSKLQTGTGASHIKSFIRYLKNF